MKRPVSVCGVSAQFGSPSHPCRSILLPPADYIVSCGSIAPMPLLLILSTPIVLGQTVAAAVGVPKCIAVHHGPNTKD